jgi:hypothetical protein
VESVEQPGRRLNSGGFLRRTLKKLAAQHRAAIVGAGRTFRRTASARPAQRINV